MMPDSGFTRGPSVADSSSTAGEAADRNSASFQLADGILVINLDDRRDRWDALLAEAGKHIGQSSLQRLPAIRGTTVEGYGKPPFFRGRQRDRTWAGRAGCALSHRAAISLAAEKKWRSVLILEDDILFASDFREQAERLAAILDKIHWDVCYLGFTDPIGPFREVASLDESHSLQQLFGCNAAHAYLVRESAYQKLLAALPTQANIWTWLTRNRAIDRWYARTLSQQFTVLAVTPSLINQYDSLSDITGRRYEHQHLTAIPSARTTRLPYGLARTLRRLHFGVSGAYDALRGWSKRRRGF